MDFTKAKPAMGAMHWGLRYIEPAQRCRIFEFPSRIFKFVHKGTTECAEQQSKMIDVYNKLNTADLFELWHHYDFEKTQSHIIVVFPDDESMVEFKLRV
jgi:hypothetical protein